MKAPRAATAAAVMTVACLLAPHAASAQRVGISAAYVTYTGSDYAGREGGLGIEGVLRHRTATGSEVGLGLAGSRAPIKESNASLSIVQVFIEARNVFQQAEARAVPFLGGRCGWIRQSGEVGDAEFTDDGFSLGATGGVEVAVNPLVAIDVGLTGSYVIFGNAHIEGETVANTSNSGFQWMFQVGVNLAVPSASARQ
ncbi:MAG TPA: hypothetical protein VF188_15860 [Longimicrobiales bacterium]